MTLIEERHFLVRGARRIGNRALNLIVVIIIMNIIIHSKHFPASDWLKSHAWFTITGCFWLNLERTLLCWGNDVKGFVILNFTSKWRQKCSPLQVIEPLTEKTWGRGCVNFGEQKNKKRNGETPLRTGKYFEWIINSVFVGYEEFCRSWRVLSTEARAQQKADLK